MGFLKRKKKTTEKLKQEKLKNVDTTLGIYFNNISKILGED